MSTIAVNADDIFHSSDPMIDAELTAALKRTMKRLATSGATLVEDVDAIFDDLHAVTLAVGLPPLFDSEAWRQV